METTEMSVGQAYGVVIEAKTKQYMGFFWAGKHYRKCDQKTELLQQVEDEILRLIRSKDDSMRMRNATARANDGEAVLINFPDSPAFDYFHQVGG